MTHQLATVGGPVMDRHAFSLDVHRRVIALVLASANRMSLPAGEA
jgi:hypothetical protein